jgi:hypothetical protein
MRKYHLVLGDGEERDVTADTVNITATGALMLSNSSGELVVCYAHGSWVMVEVETRDDRGAEAEEGKKKGGKK